MGEFGTCSAFRRVNLLGFCFVFVVPGGPSHGVCGMHLFLILKFAFAWYFSRTK